MNWADAKDSEVVLKDISVNITREGGSPTAVELTDSQGNRVRVSLNCYSAMKVLIPAKPKMVKRYRLALGSKSLQDTRVFNERYEAEEAVRGLSLLYSDSVTVEEFEQPE